MGYIFLSSEIIFFCFSEIELEQTGLTNVGCFSEIIFFFVFQRVSWSKEVYPIGIRFQ